MARNHRSDDIKNKRIGEVNYNLKGQKMKIIDYVNYDNVTVLFDDGAIRDNVNYQCFKNGTVKNYNTPKVYGVGITGTRQTKINGKIIKEYSTWCNMLQRCYDYKKQTLFPHYQECSVCTEWLCFDNFYDWCHKQDNWDKVIENPNNYHLDKDIIVKGNKQYSSTLCSFVPSSVNVLFVKGDDMRGQYPIGVSLIKQSGRYRSRCSMKLIGEGISHHTADTPEEAFLFYKKDKERLIKTIAKREYEQGNIIHKCYKAMMNYEVEITD